ncbi:hypothetical protein IMSAGC022_01535 [Alistipes sp.]|nr:hypothetical protein IMSAGC022_01535 [Alistipes sp.]
MKFFDRTAEIASLKETLERSRDVAQFTVVTGRRRIGKTSLVLKAYEQEPFLYFFVGRKAESELCESWVAEIESKLGIPVLGCPDHFSEIFEFLMKLSCTQPITVFIDEFQEFLRVNKSVFSDMQRIWDLYQTQAHINLLVCGSIHSLMSKIFRDKKEPLYGRQTQFMHVRPFTPSVLKEILATYNPQYTSEDLLALYAFTGGVAKYVQLLVDSDGTTKRKMLDRIVKADSVLLGEGKAILIEEFGKDYGIYFSILSAIARGRNTRAAIEQSIGREVGGYLSKLEDDYGIISKKQPLFEKTATKNVRYAIDDNFFMFWFRFIHKYNYILEIEGYDNVKTIIERDYATFSGIMLERYFRNMLIEQHRCTRIGSWWDRKGENEIDLIAENELEDTATFYEVKRKAANIDLDVLKSKAEVFLHATGKFHEYAISYSGLSMEDM